MRDDARDHADDAPRDRDNPWGDAAGGGPEASRLADLGLPTTPAPGAALDDGDPAAPGADDARAEQYALWLARMREKRERTRALVRPENDPADAAGRAHWSTDALFAESRHVEERESVSRPNPWRTRQLLSTLDLTEGASFDDIGSAYRRLARTHHPDRYAEADAQTREFHAQKMADINDAYRSLKALHATGG